MTTAPINSDSTLTADAVGIGSTALFTGRVDVGDTVRYRVTPYRGAGMVEREGIFCMWDYEHAGGLGGSYRTGHYVIDRGNGLTDIISYDQIISANSELSEPQS